MYKLHMEAVLQWGSKQGLQPSMPGAASQLYFWLVWANYLTTLPVPPFVKGRQ